MLASWLAESGQTREEFSGVKIEQMPQLESLFQVAINVYALGKDETLSSVQCLYLSEKSEQEVSSLPLGHMHLLSWENHLFYLKSLYGAFKSFRCENCCKKFSSTQALCHHRRERCGREKGQLVTFNHGYYRIRNGLMKRIRAAGIDQPVLSQRPPCLLMAWDIEVSLKPIQVEEQNATQTTAFTHEHNFLALGTVGNIGSFYHKPSFFFAVDYDSDVNKACDDFLDYVFRVSHEQKQILGRMYQPALEGLRKSVEVAEEKGRKGEARRLRGLQKELELYCQQVTLASFNGSGFDLKVLRSVLIPKLIDREGRDNVSVLIKSSKYILVQTPHTRWIDAMKFLGPGMSLNAFLKAMQIPQLKGWFPYEAIQSDKDLEATQLPIYPRWFSTLRSCNPLNEEYDEYRRLRVNHGASREKALKELGLKAVPVHGKKLHADLCKEFRETCTTMKDWTKKYLGLDIKPFLEALEKLSDLYWNEFKIDAFRDHVSVPGIAHVVLFQEYEAFAKQTGWPRKSLGFYSPDKPTYEMIRRDLVGGVSTIYVRKFEVGEDIVPGLPAKQLFSVDVTALYGSIIGSDTFTGPGITRRAENGFKAEYEGRQLGAYRALEFFSYQTGEVVQSAFRGGEKKFGSYRVDGYIKAYKAVIEYAGCHWHLCRFCKNHSPDDPFPNGNGKTYGEQQAYEDKRIRHLQTHYANEINSIAIIPECEFRRLFTTPGAEYYDEWCAFLAENPLLNRPSQLTQEQIIEQVKNDELHGILEVDIHTPSVLKPKYAHWPPIQRHADVGREDLDPLMRKYCEEEEVLEKPRDQVVQTFWAKKFALTSKLLMFYLNVMHLVVTKVYTVVEYQQERPFQTLLEKAAQLRRDASNSRHTQLLADLFKLLINSAYGKALSRIEDYQRVLFLTEGEAAEKQTDPLFVDSDFVGHLQDDTPIFEVSLRRARITHRLPVQFGFSILCNAKLWLLRFIYEVLPKLSPVIILASDTG